MTNTELKSQQQQQQKHPPLVDALAYVDEFDEKAQKQAQLLVEQEMKTFVPKNYLEHMPIAELHFTVEFEDSFSFSISNI
jgi:hypothetical protein